MTTVRDATFAMLREHGMTTIFGNPGSTELPMLADFPDDFRYVLGLQEAVAVGMADGYRAGERPPGATSTCTPRRASATGWARSSTRRRTSRRCWSPPGQQARSLMTLQANLTNRDATRMPHPLVKWSYEPPRAQDVPHALARAIHLAALPPAGPAFVSIPMDDWDAEVDDARVAAPAARTVGGRAVRRPRGGRARWPQRLDGGAAPGAGRRPGHRRRAAAGTPRRARRAPAAAGLGDARRRAAGGIGFPEDHPLFQGILPPAVGPVGRGARGLRPRARRRLVGLPLLPEHPRAAAGRGHGAGRDHERPRRGGARADGRRDRRRRRADARGAGRRRSGESDREPPPPRPGARGRRADGTPLSPSSGARGARRGVPGRRHRRARVARRARSRCATSCGSRSPGSYYFGAGGGLGFGLPAAIGVQLAQPDAAGRLRARRGLGAVRDPGASGPRRPTRCRCTFLVLRNDEYAILKWFARARAVTGAPGLDLPAARRRGAGRRATASQAARVGGRDELREALSDGARRRAGRARGGRASRPAWRWHDVAARARLHPHRPHPGASRRRTARPTASPRARPSRCAPS